jgi:hypothetical protein
MSARSITMATAGLPRFGCNALRVGVTLHAIVIRDQLVSSMPGEDAKSRCPMQGWAWPKSAKSPRYSAPAAG